MSKKDDELNDIDEGSDESNLDFDINDDFGDMDFGEDEGDEPAGKRSPITEFSSGATNALKLNSTDAKNIGKSISDNFPSVGGVADDVLSSAGEITSHVRNFKESLAPDIRKFKIAGRKVLPLAKKFVPNKIYDKLKSALETEETYRAQSLEDQRNTVIKDSLANMFKTQIDMSQEKDIADTTDKMIDRRVEDRKFTTNITILSKIKNILKSQYAFFQTGVKAYIIKSLELKYKSLFISQDQLVINQKILSIVEDKLKTISHNTALPDIQKQTRSEGFKEAMREKTFGKMAMTAGDFSSTFFKKMNENIKKNIFDKALAASKEAIGMGTELTEGYAEMEEMKNEFGGEEESGASKVGSKSINLLKTLGIKFGGKALTKMGGQKAKDFDELVKTMKGNAPAIINDKLKELADKEGMLGKAAEFAAENIFPKLAEERGIVSNIVAESPTDTVPWDVVSRKTLIEIIPGYLAKITKNTETIALGEEAEELVYDFNSETFVSVKELQEKTTKKFFGTKKTRAVEIAKLVGTIVTGYNKNSGDPDLLAMAMPDIVKFCTNSAKHNKDLLPKEILKYKNGKSHNQKYISWVFKDIADPMSVADILVKAFFKDDKVSRDITTEFSQERLQITNKRDEFLKEIGKLNVFGQKRHFSDLIGNEKTLEQIQKFENDLKEKYKKKYKKKYDTPEVQEKIKKEIAIFAQSTGLNHSLIRNILNDIDYDQLYENVDSVESRLKSTIDIKEKQREKDKQPKKKKKKATDEDDIAETPLKDVPHISGPGIYAQKSKTEAHIPLDSPETFFNEFGNILESMNYQNIMLEIRDILTTNSLTNSSMLSMASAQSLMDTLKLPTEGKSKIINAAKALVKKPIDVTKFGAEKLFGVISKTSSFVLNKIKKKKYTGDDSEINSIINMLYAKGITGKKDIAKALSKLKIDKDKKKNITDALSKLRISKYGKEDISKILDKLKDSKDKDKSTTKKLLSKGVEGTQFAGSKLLDTLGISGGLLRSGIEKTSSTVFKGISSGIKKVGEVMKIVDVYVEGEVKPGYPKITAKQIRNKRLVRSDGKDVSKMSHLTMPILSKRTKETLLSEDDIKKGLVDVNGKPIIKKGSSLIQKIGSTLKAAKGAVTGTLGAGLAGITGVLGSVKGLFGKKADGKDGFFGKFKNIFKSSNSLIVEKLTELIGIASKMASKGTTREGSYEDYLEDQETSDKTKEKKDKKKDTEKKAPKKKGGILKSAAGKLISKYGGVAAGALSGAAAASASAIAAGATAAAGAASTGAMATGAFLLTNPVGWAILGTIAVGATGYGLYKIFKKSDQEKSARKARMDMYGAENNQEKIIRKLEKVTLKNIKKGKKFDKGDIEDWADDFGLDEDKKEQVEYWLTWYQKRFVPALMLYDNLLRQATKKGIDDIDDVNAKIVTRINLAYKKMAAPKLAQYKKYVPSALGYKMLTVRKIRAAYKEEQAKTKTKKKDPSKKDTKPKITPPEIKPTPDVKKSKNVKALIAGVAGTEIAKLVTGTKGIIASRDWASAGILAVGPVGYGLFKIFKYFKDSDQEKVARKARMDMYGVGNDQKGVIEDLEKVTLKNIKKGKKFDKGDIEDWADDFGFDEDKKEQVEYWLTWYKKRFVPALVLYEDLLKKASKKGISEIDDIDMKTIAQVNSIYKKTAISELAQYKKYVPSVLGFKMFSVSKMRAEYKKKHTKDKKASATKIQPKLPPKKTSPVITPPIVKQTPAIEANKAAQSRSQNMAADTIALKSSVMAATVIPDDSELGSVSAKYESGSKGSMSIGFDRVGGTSYGTYQIAVRPGTFQKFLTWCDKNGGKDVANRLRKRGDPDRGPVGPVAKEWVKLAGEGKIQALEKGFIKETHYQAALNKLPSDIKSKINSSSALQQALWSTSVQHGSGGAASIFKKSFSKDDSTSSYIKKIYNDRKTKFRSSTPSVRASVMRRFEDEKSITLAMIDKAKEDDEIGSDDGLRRPSYTQPPSLTMASASMPSPIATKAVATTTDTGAAMQNARNAVPASMPREVVSKATDPKVLFNDLLNVNKNQLNVLHDIKSGILFLGKVAGNSNNVSTKDIANFADQMNKKIDTITSGGDEPREYFLNTDNVIDITKKQYSRI